MYGIERMIDPNESGYDKIKDSKIISKMLDAIIYDGNNSGNDGSQSDKINENDYLLNDT